MMVSSTQISEHSKLAVTLGTHGYEDHRNIQISHGALKSALTITFQRTLRVPDNKSVNSLPPSLGQFPLYSVAKYKDRMPEDMAKKGGIFLPMFQKEAMWINFSSKEPFALKIYVGGVNAISGVPINESPEATLKRINISDKVKQDYVVLPEQPWLDGIASEDGSIRQFVAMPMGSGFSVEAQITGEEKIGGLQFEITPTKRGCPETLTIKLVKGNSPYSTVNNKVVLRPREKGLGDDSTIEDLKKIIRDEFDIAVKHQQLRFLSSAKRMADPILSDDKLTFSGMWIPEDVVLQVADMSAVQSRYEEVERDGLRLCNSSAPKMKKAGGGGSFDFVAFGSTAPPGQKACKEYAKRGSSSHSQPEQMALSALPCPPSMSRSSDTSSTRSRRSSSFQQIAGIRRQSPQAPAAPQILRPEVKAMSLAPGGLIKQSINADPYPSSTWSTEDSILFNVQLLNSTSFFAVTGRAPPPSPIDAMTYKRYGYPFFDLWKEELSGVKGEFGGIKSVGMIEEQKAQIKATSEKKGFWSTVTGDDKEEQQVENGEVEFVGEDELGFPVIMLDMRTNRTFKPIGVMEELRRAS